MSQEAKSLPHSYAALKKKTADLVDHSCTIADEAGPNAMERLEIQLIVGFYWNTACRGTLHGFGDCVGIPEVVLVALPERFGISGRYLLYVMAERT